MPPTRVRSAEESVSTKLSGLKAVASVCLVAKHKDSEPVWVASVQLLCIQCWRFRKHFSQTFSIDVFSKKMKTKLLHKQMTRTMQELCLVTFKGLVGDFNLCVATAASTTTKKAPGPWGESTTEGVKGQG